MPADSLLVTIFVVAMFVLFAGVNLALLALAGLITVVVLLALLARHVL